MPGAYVLINAEVGAEEAVLEQIKRIPSVKEAYIVYGVYDLVVRLESNDMTALKDEITEKIRKIDLVRSTLTMILIE
ncbi:MAG TPA: Lrp/AsnC ligand binding domain-containing protein [Candidatus Hodarchaeales archaeon]|jgi:DNA-binding Lrp family transcriptional regulator|nr:Lrp/AsnC ligand binding domain-containing protein [Candidatus Hodarchaeales archaeon]